MVTHSGQAKIADFGIARIESSSMTQAGTMMGTPAYMSPEQFMGQTVDSRTDIYSAGVLLYQLLTGERPVRGQHHGHHAQGAEHRAAGAVGAVGDGEAGARRRGRARDGQAPGGPLRDGRRVLGRAARRVRGARAGARPPAGARRRRRDDDRALDAPRARAPGARPAPGARGRTRFQGPAGGRGRGRAAGAGRRAGRGSRCPAGRRRSFRRSSPTSRWSRRTRCSCPTRP